MRGGITFFLSERKRERALRAARAARARHFGKFFFRVSRVARRDFGVQVRTWSWLGAAAHALHSSKARSGVHQTAGRRSVRCWTEECFCVAVR